MENTVGYYMSYMNLGISVIPKREDNCLDTHLTPYISFETGKFFYTGKNSNRVKKYKGTLENTETGPLHTYRTRKRSNTMRVTSKTSRSLYTDQIVRVDTEGEEVLERFEERLNGKTNEVNHDLGV